MYTVLRFSQMVADATRMDAYERAVERYVRPGMVVLDIGAGTGIMSLLCARAGARRVHACDPNPAVHLLTDLARENGLSDRIVVHHTVSTELTLPERADVVISDLRGLIPLHGGNCAAQRDARARHLKPDGVLLPQRDDFFVGAFEHGGFAAVLATGVSGFVRRGLSSDAVWKSITNRGIRDDWGLRSTDMVTTSSRWGHVVYGTDDMIHEGEVVLEATRSGTVHGLALWFDATLAPGIGWSTGPGTDTIYARYLLPLERHLSVARTDRLRVILRADEDAERTAWETTHEGADGTIKARLRQTNFFGAPISMAEILRQTSSYVPRLSDEGKRALDLLGRFDGTRSVHDLVAAYPAAEKEIRALVTRYGR